MAGNQSTLIAPIYKPDESPHDFKGVISGELWIVIWHGDYAISSYGRVMRTSGGKGASRGKLLSQRVNPAGYACCDLWHNRHHQAFLTHVLVAAAFIGALPPEREVNHKDGVKLNNHANNLEYVTHAENMSHAHLTGLCSLKLSEAEVESIRHQLSLGIKQRDIAKSHNCHQAHVHRILHGKSRSRKWQ